MTEKFVDAGDVSELFGSLDGNLSHIQQKYSVSVVSRNGKLKIIGEETNVEEAYKAIEALMNMNDKGRALDSQTVRYVTSMASEGALEQLEELKGDGLCVTSSGKILRARTVGQKRYVEAIKENTIVLGIGPAGTGKTYLAVAQAVAAFRAKEVNRIILTRPAVEAGERLGFLPGDLQNKVDPYLRPLYDALYEMMPQDVVDKKLETGEIEVAPLAFMRGRTLSNAMVILDEAQNTTPMQMKMFLTRLGENSRMVINGDLSQTDLPRGVQSGLADALDILADVKEIAKVTFTERDVVRHGLVARIVKAYDKRYASRKGLVG